MISIPGAQVLPLWDAVPALPDVRLIVPRDERSGAFMGEGFGLAGLGPAVVMNTLGPGVANEFVGMESARRAGVPVLFVSPDQPPSKRGRLREVFQGLDHQLMLGRACKRSVRISSASELSTVLADAFELCLYEPRGPVRVDISFPLLFEPSWYEEPGRSERPAEKEPVRRRWLVLESPDQRNPFVASSDEDETRPEEIVWPGVGEPGFGLPLALGLCLAVSDDQVTLVTEEGHLERSLDSLAVARATGIALRVSAMPDVKAKTAAAVLEALGERLEHRPPDLEAMGPFRGLHVVLVR